jgi:type IV secretory pathway VirJ component
VARSSGAVIGDLPLVELPPPAAGAPLVVILSGDGGWRDIDKVLADDLGQRGLAVLGWDSLSYFWTAKTPEQLGRDLAVALSYYGEKWHTGSIALVGYSFGADVLPFAVDRLPAGLRARIAQLSLLGYAGKADFKIHISGWLGESPSAAALPDAPEMARIDPRRVQCFYGVDESDSACPGLAASGAELVMLPGGHHFGGDYGAIAARIAEGLSRRSARLQ